LDPSYPTFLPGATLFSLKLETAGPVAVGVYPAANTHTGQSMRDIGSFTVYDPLTASGLCAGWCVCVCVSLA
jgi:hypothetical protein